VVSTVRRSRHDDGQRLAARVHGARKPRPEGGARFGRFRPSKRVERQLRNFGPIVARISNVGVPVLHIRQLCILTAAILFSTVALAQQPNAEPDSTSRQAEAGILSLLPADATTEHVFRAASEDLSYTATAGTIDLIGQNAQRTAKIFYTAYVAKNPASVRPITFAFNGGPGAASAYLHLGLIGPRIVDFSDPDAAGRMPRLVDNPESWLPFTDLVFIDPVGTGWSRAASDEIARNFYGVRQDAESLAKFIALYIQRNNRLSSPKYLVGESYGGFRAAKVASAMKDGQGLLTSGIVMVSPFLDGRFLSNSDDPLSAALQLPSLGAARLERDQAFAPEKLAEIESFAMKDYLTMLAGPSPVGDLAQAFYRRVSDITGISIDAVERTRGFVGDIYNKEAAGEGRVVSPYEASHVVTDAYPEAPYNQTDDPILDGYTRAYAPAFASYARNELGYQSEITYTLLNEEVNRRWEWNGSRGGDSRALSSAAGDMRDLLSVIPGLRIVVAHGLADALTPYGASRYVIEHLPPNLVGDRVALRTYSGGHMFYTRPGSRRAFAADVKTFYAAGDDE
jgi:carboxypeptidase C (cathepsin A)